MISRPVSLVALAGLFISTPSPVAEAGVDGAYGRLRGDLEVQVGPSVAWALPEGRALQAAPAVGAELALLYVQSAGLHLRYLHSSKDQVRTKAPARAPFRMNQLAIGASLQPIFLGRFATDRERGPAWVDLFADSWHVSAGVHLDLEHRAQAGMELGTGIALPLWPKANALYLHLDATHQWPGNRAAGLPHGMERQWLFGASLRWHQTVNAGLVELHDAL